MINNIYIGNEYNIAKQPEKIYAKTNNYSGEVFSIYIADNMGLAKCVYTKAILPLEYQQVEYVRNPNNNMYINLGIAPKKNSTKIEVLVKFNSFDNITNPHIFGCQDANNTNRFKVYSNSTPYLGIGIGSNTTTITSEKLTTENIYFITLDASLSSPKLSFKIYPNGTLRSTTLSSGTLSSKEIYLFGQNNNGSLANACRAEIYSFKLYESGVLKRNLYPCYNKNSEVIGFYDLQNSKFYTGLGSGTFEKGNNINQEL